MDKRALIAMVAVFAAWTVIDFIIHNLILMDAYASTADLWRPREEMKLSLIYLATAISAVVFVYLYARFFAEKNPGNGLRYGFFIGLAWGVGMGYGTYAVMPLPYSLALGWFLGTLVEFIAAGLLVGLIVREE